MPVLRNYHILISHSWDYNEHYETICRWLDEAHYFEHSNFSVPYSNPIDANSKKELQERLAEKIRNCSCFLIICGMYVNYSEWINYEIQVAQNYKKPIIGVIPWGQEKIPSEVQNATSVMVGWNSESVIKAIRDYAIPRNNF